MRTRNLVLAALVTGLVALGAPAGATTLALPNGTQTLFDVATGGIEFHFDHDSPYQLVGNGPTVLVDDLGFGSIYELLIPNFYDPLPRKEILVEMFGANSGAAAEDLPRVLDIIGSDAPFGEVGPSVPVIGIFVDAATGTTDNGLVRRELWEMFPNPDWEVVKIWAPIGFELVRIHITTQSIPEPAGAALLGSGLLALALLRRRR